MGVRCPDHHDHDDDHHDHDHDHAAASLIGAPDMAAAQVVKTRRNRALLAWYESQSRDLPWRGTRDPYRVLVSEVMLQQTQAGRVISHFDRFLECFPTIEALAEAPLRDVLSAWSGLGYNSRAQRLHRTASLIIGHGWPQTVESLERLPGVGPYTARAVAAFAFGLDVVPVDTNVRRVLSRWHDEPLKGAALQAAAEADACGLPAATWSQAVMDLSAILCRPRKPRCDVCPVERWCEGPQTYVPPGVQPSFEGSTRQLRGAIVRTLVSGPAGVATLAGATGFRTAAVRDALDVLEHEGLVERNGEDYELPG